ncbi:glycosyltransferase family 2 protein [Synechococcus elongatus]|uniref:glycosyltransferase family 2 protein n=1 Tax=Synechococcus elongatus TaxID=32046 RepID=UPI000F7F454A|nr:glycosyltransferase family 2 protein [Synechococcus elongatus]
MLDSSRDTAAIALFIFNRPDLASKVMEAIAAVRPKVLMVVADGSRSQEEAELCKATRDIAIRNIDWPCELVTNFSETNLGCRQRVSLGIDWVFQNVEEAIILEDDCLPHPDFFSFCTYLLDYYRDDQRVWTISGDNFQDGQIRGDGSYYFSRYPHTWGWATWRRAWQHYDVNMTDWPLLRESDCLESVFDSPEEALYWISVWDHLYHHGIPNTWDYQWIYTCWKNNALTVLPNRNLVSNIGFRNDGTHCLSDDHPLANLPTYPIEEIQHPSFHLRDKIADQYFAEKYLDIGSLTQLLS